MTTTAIRNSDAQLGLTAKDRVLGALWGQACGDAFGMPNSFVQVPVWRLEMEAGPNNSPYHAGYKPGRITDDTEQAQSLTEAFFQSSEGSLDYHFVAKELEAWLDRVGGMESLAVGPSTKLAMGALKNGVPIEETGKRGVTNGAPMRVSVVGVWAAIHNYTFDELLADVHASCLPTHNTSIAISGAAAVAAATWAGMRGLAWDETVSQICLAADRGAELGNWVYAPSISARVRNAIYLISAATTEVEAATIASEVIGMGEATAESVPAAIAIAAWAGRNPAIAIRVAGNCRGDTDTVAAMAGAISGAFSGPSALPSTWTAAVRETNPDVDIESWADRLLLKL